MLGEEITSIFSALSTEGVSRKTHTHLLSQQQSSRDSTLSVFLRKENGATEEFLRTKSNMESGARMLRWVINLKTSKVLGTLQGHKCVQCDCQDSCWVCIAWNELDCDT